MYVMLPVSYIRILKRAFTSNHTSKIMNKKAITTVKTHAFHITPYLLGETKSNDRQPILSQEHGSL